MNYPTMRQKITSLLPICGYDNSDELWADISAKILGYQAAKVADIRECDLLKALNYLQERWSFQHKYGFNDLG